MVVSVVSKQSPGDVCRCITTNCHPQQSGVSGKCWHLTKVAEEPREEVETMTKSSKSRITEPVFNAALGDVLQTKHPRWRKNVTVEETNVFRDAAGLRPDILIRQPGGLPVCIESEYVPASTVEKDARDRLGRTLQEDGRRIEQTVALRIPAHLPTSGRHKLHKLIEDALFEFCVYSRFKGKNHRWPEKGWIRGGVDDLAISIELVALSEDEIASGLDVLSNGIADAAKVLRDDSVDKPGILEDIASVLHQRDGEQTSRMAMAIIANAMIFQTAVAGTASSDKSFKIETLSTLSRGSTSVPKIRVMKHWQGIIQKINYWPIFRLAADLLEPIPNGTAQKILDTLALVSSELVNLGATSKHDLSGRMFQRLIVDRKFLATFYTLPSSAVLLAELAIERLDVEWSKEEAVTSMRIADFACGTGALLHASYNSMLSRYRRRGGEDRILHSRMMESVLVGSDIMPAAAHLTASVLSSAHPTVPFRNTSIITLPYGEPPDGSGRELALGALDLIKDEETLPLFGTGEERLRGLETIDEGSVQVPHRGFDMVIMNPPFTRSTGQEAEKVGVPVPSFAGFSNSDEEQRKMSKVLTKITKRDMVGTGQAGLASNFIDVAHIKLKEGGVLALVLPATFPQGKAWEKARKLLDRHYIDIVVVSIIADKATDRAFSADTGMAEVLVIATRKTGDHTGQEVRFVNLARRPESLLDAVTMATTVKSAPHIKFFTPLYIGGGWDAGNIFVGSLSNAGSAGTADEAVVRAAQGLLCGDVFLPRITKPFSLPLVSLSELGERGLYHMDIYGTEISKKSGLPRGPFDIESLTKGGIPSWPALWEHDATRETRLVVKPDHQGIVRPGCDKHASDAWKKAASRLHFNRDFRLNSQPLGACFTADPAIGGTAWPSFFCDDQRWEFPLLLWANTTLGLLAFWWIGTTQHSGRVRLSISKLPELVTIDVRQFSADQLVMAEAIFNDFKEQTFAPANEAWEDETRKSLDRAVLVDLLGLPADIMEPLDLLRRKFCAEPSVHGGKSTALKES